MTSCLREGSQSHDSCEQPHRDPAAHRHNCIAIKRVRFSNGIINERHSCDIAARVKKRRAAYLSSTGFQDRSSLNEQSTSRDTALPDTVAADEGECFDGGDDREHRMQLTILLRPAARIPFLASTSTLVLLFIMHDIRDLSLFVNLIACIPSVQQ
jgi:hypothetical protein